MSNPVKISAVIITFNEEEKIERCIDSVKYIADEIVVIDSFSTDNTVAICNSKGVRVFQNKFEGFTAQKKYAVQQASYDFILSLDADEYLSKQLYQSILKTKAHFQHNGYFINRLNSYSGRWIKSCGWYPDSKIRLWDRRKGNWHGQLLHEVVVLKENTSSGLLEGDLLHEAYQNVSQLLKKINQYSDLYALQHCFRKRISVSGIVIKTIASFSQNYFIKHGLFDGYAGLVIAASNANGVFYKYAKLHELNHSLKASLIITTYNRKDALELVLKSVLQQSVLPHEVIIADDGSREDTKQLVNSYVDNFPIPLIHCWHADTGFRLSTIRNKAIALTKCDYIIMVDGDMVLNTNFIADHINNAWQGRFVQGSRVLLKEKITVKALNVSQTKFSFFTSGIKNRKNTIHARLLSRLFSYYGKDFYHVRGANLAFWKSDVIKVNGFNEDFIGWGREDSEFAVRMYYSGVKRLHLKFSGFGYHLYHNENSKDMLPENQKILDNAITNKSEYCMNGLRQYL